MGGDVTVASEPGVEAGIAARIALAETVPTTPAGLAALTGFLREQTTALAESFFDRDEEHEAFFKSLDITVCSILARAT